MQYYLGLFSQPLLSLGFSLYLQTAIKYVLTEGDKYLISALATLKDTGMYALSANYGGLIARMLFRPIEDSSRNLFAKLCSDAGESRQVSGVTKVSEPKQNGDNVKQAANVLQDILRVYGLVSLVAFAIGPAAAPLLLRLVAGARWSDTGAGDVLGTYCYYIPLLAVNGVSEAFVSATASTSELRKQSIWMGGFSVAFAASAYLFLSVLQMGAKGLVLANCVNMVSRIVFNLSFVKRYFAERGIVSSFWKLISLSLMLTLVQNFNAADIVPNLSAIAATAVVPSVLSRTQGILRQYGLFGDLVHVGAVGAVFAAFVYVHNHQITTLTMLTMIAESPRSVHISWTATGGSAAASYAVVGAYLRLTMTLWWQCFIYSMRSVCSGSLAISYPMSRHWYSNQTSNFCVVRMYPCLSHHKDQSNHAYAQPFRFPSAPKHSESR